MPPPTREEVNALIERRKPLGFFTVPDCLEAVAMLTALQAENDRLRAQASPAWVALSERKPTKEDLPYIWSNERGNVFYADLSTPWCDTGSWAIIHWMRVSPCPPPESAADRQRREDEQAAQKYIDNATCCFAVGEARRAFVAGRESARKEATP